MLIIVVGLAGLLSFGSANLVQGVSEKQTAQEERVISHMVGSVETVKQQDVQKQPEPVEVVPVSIR